MPKKVKRAALALGAVAARQGEEDRRRRQASRSTRPRPSRWPGILATLGLGKALIVDAKSNANFVKSARNLPKAKWLAPEGLNVYDILNHSDLVIAAGVLKQVEKRVVSTRLTTAAQRSRVEGIPCVHPNLIIKRPLLTEKGTLLKETGGTPERPARSREPSSPQVLFEVATDANKIEIRHAVETLFNVKVVDVRTQIVRGKEKRVGRFVGRRSNWKKAIVTLAAGDNIEFFEGV